MSVSNDGKINSFFINSLSTMHFCNVIFSGTLLKYFGAQPTVPAPDVSSSVSASTADDTAGEFFLDGKWLHSLLI